MTGFSEEPRSTYSAKMDKAGFFAWLQTREGGRYELKDGEIVVHAGSTQNHVRVSARLLTAIANQLDPDIWLVGAADFAVETVDGIRYPDLLVARVLPDPTALSTSTPVVIVEVLSPSSGGRDFHEKLAEYTSLPSLQAYIVASQDKPHVWLWQRDADTHTFPALPVEFAGLECVITIDALAISLPLADIYRGIASA